MAAVTLFLCGDVMTGRGIDQILATPCDPALHERYVADARDYVALAEAKNGPIPRGVPPAYVWGEALEALARAAPAARIVNLETAVTTSDAWEDKGINYRMHPANVGCLAAAKIDCCALANNHVLDWGAAGLLETLATLHAAGIRTAGAGRDLAEARAIATLPLPAGGQVLVAAYGMRSSGIPGDWAAGESRPGVALLDDLSERSVACITREIAAVKRPGDVAIVSIHWSGNWGYAIGAAERRFARRLVEAAGVDIVHGHSSHHPKAIEVHAGKLLLYGCGDLVNDYEGIGGYEAWRGDLGLVYFPTVDAASGTLLALALVPMRMRRFRLERAPIEDARWLAETLSREGRAFGTRVEIEADGRLALAWDRAGGGAFG